VYVGGGPLGRRPTLALVDRTILSNSLLHFMIIKTKRFGEISEDNVSQLVVRALESDNPGRLEETTETARNTCAALGRLINYLAEQKILSAQQVIGVCGYYSEESTFL